MGYVTDDASWKVRRSQSVSIFPNLNHPCCCLVYYYLLGRIRLGPFRNKNTLFRFWNERDSIPFILLPWQNERNTIPLFLNRNENIARRPRIGKMCLPLWFTNLSVNFITHRNWKWTWLKAKDGQVGCRFVDFVAPYPKYFAFFLLTEIHFFKSGDMLHCNSFDNLSLIVQRVDNASWCC